MGFVHVLTENRDVRAFGVGALYRLPEANLKNTANFYPLNPLSSPFISIVNQMELL